MKFSTDDFEYSLGIDLRLLLRIVLEFRFRMGGGIFWSIEVVICLFGFVSMRSEISFHRTRVEQSREFILNIFWELI